MSSSTPRAGDTFLPVTLVAQGLDVDVLDRRDELEEWPTQLAARLPEGLEVHATQHYGEAHLHFLYPYSAGDDPEALRARIGEVGAEVFYGCGYDLEVWFGDGLITWEQLEWHRNLPIRPVDPFAGLRGGERP